MTGISAVSAGSNWALQQATTSNRQASQQAFQQLGSALQAGDVNAAQNAYSTLAQMVGSNPNSPLAAALQKIGSDLQSGDINGAQSAFAALQQQTQAGHSHHHHRHAKANNDGQDSQPAPPAASNDGTGTTVDLTV